jgi:hypothetical protein
MKKNNNKKKTSKKNDLRIDYDFASLPGGVRGKHAKAYRSGTNIAVLADDVASAFPTDDSVNQALRVVMQAAEAIPKKRKLAKKSQRRGGSATRKGTSRRRRG